MTKSQINKVKLNTDYTFTPYTFTATAGQTVFSIAPSTVNGIGGVLVEVNGISLPPADVSVVGSNVTIPACDLNDEVVIRVVTRFLAGSSATVAENVGFVQSGAGAVARTVDAKLKEWVSVKDYGAVLDGVADDTAAVQAAFNAANGTSKVVVFNGPSCKITSTLSQNNHSKYFVNWGSCAVSFTGSVGTHLLDMTQAGDIEHKGGVFTGNANNHFVKTQGSVSALATAFPTIPAENQWSRQLRFKPNTVIGFDIVFDFRSFSRELWISGYITGNKTSIKATGKVVNMFVVEGTVLYSALSASQALYVRGDAADATYRYAEGLFCSNAILDTVGTTVDVQDVYLLDMSGCQIKTAAGGISVDITKGVCPLTRDIYLDRVLFQGKLRLGNGLASQHLFNFQGSSLSFSDTADTAINIQANCKGVLINGASFSSPTGTPRMFAVGATCAAIKLEGLNPDPGTYTNAPTIDSTSLTGTEAEFKASFTPGIAFGGASVGITYSNQNGRYYMSGGFVTGHFEVTLTSKGSSTGVATVTGLPFLCKNVNGAGGVSRYSGMNTAFTPIMEVVKETAAITVKNGAAGSETNFSNADFSNTSVINGWFRYPVS